MKTVRLVALLLCIVLACAGCNSGEVENQAYALVMGVDYDGTDIKLTIRIPKIGKPEQASESTGSGGSNYLVLSASAQDYPSALERLQWTVARELNLSQLKLIVVSEGLASSPAFSDLIAEIAETRHLYTTAAFIVCDGMAHDFVDGMETILGIRLSSEITAMFRHYARHGYIPMSTFADLYYGTRSCYSDPTGILGFYASKDSTSQKESSAVSLVTPDRGSAQDSAQTDDARRYLGAGIFRDGVLVCRLDAKETLLMNLASEKVEDLSYSTSDGAFGLSCSGKPRLRVSIQNGRTDISLIVCLTSETYLSPDVKEQLRASVEGEMTDFIRKCQRLRVEPFGFAARAARAFTTIEAWRRFNWRERFSEAEVRVEVRIVDSYA